MSQRDKELTMDSSKKILVVDDFATMRKIAIKMLNKLGFEIIEEADSGKSAWEKINNKKYDIVLTDWNMPEMTGIELLKAIRESDDLKNTPVILISAESEKEHIVEASKLGVNGYILKPYAIDTLKGVLDKL